MTAPRGQFQSGSRLHVAWRCFKASPRPGQAIKFYSGWMSKLYMATNLKDKMTKQKIIKMEVNKLCDKINCCVDKLVITLLQV